jgi:hypothetical protein
MKPAIFTPTHDTQYLDELYASLCNQTYDEWEWVVITNNGAQMPAHILHDSRVRHFEAPQSIQGVGGLKAYACKQILGDLFIEVDHDDILAHDAVESIVMAAQETGAGFIYSDYAEFRANGSNRTYDSNAGWETYKCEINGDEHTAMRAFPANPSSLYQIFFAPNHVRVWTREAYEETGGHDQTLHVADDHDLICRTYLKGFSFQHIQKPLYLYRLLDFGKNTYRQQQDDIQRLQKEVRDKYTHQIVMEWCHREGYAMVDLGGVANKPDGFIGVDLRKGADVQLDAIKFLQGVVNDANFWDPVKGIKNIGCIRAADFLEHIPPDRVVELMNSVYDALIPGGWFLTSTPSTDGRGAFQDPTHISFWNENSFWYYTNHDYAQYVEGINCRFQAARVWTDCPSKWHKENHIAYVHADLVALKGQPQIGYTSI